jgi:hypothetical protein
VARAKELGIPVIEKELAADESHTKFNVDLYLRNAGDGPID